MQHQLEWAYLVLERSSVTDGLHSSECDRREQHELVELIPSEAHAALPAQK